MAIEKISIIGCGALGIMYASHMAKSIPADNIRFVADAERIKRYRENGIYVNGIKQEFNFFTPEDDVEKADLLIFAVKSVGLEKAAEMVCKHVGENTLIISILNGISSEEILKERYIHENIIYCMVGGMDATRTGESVNFAKMGRVALGSVGKYKGLQDVNAVKAFFDKIKIECYAEEDIMKVIWWKYILNIGINQVSALLRASYGAFQRKGYAQNAMIMAMEEALEVSKAEGIEFEGDTISSCIELIANLTPEAKTSMHQDIEAGRKTEVEMFSGTLIKLAEKHNIRTPVNRFLYNAIKALEEKNK